MQENPCPYARMLLVCVNERAQGESSCGGRDSKPLAEALKKAVEAAGMKGKIRVTRTLCLGLCDEGPNVMIFPEGVLLSDVRPEDVPAIVDKYVKSETK